MSDFESRLRKLVPVQPDRDPLEVMYECGWNAAKADTESAVNPGRSASKQAWHKPFAGGGLAGLVTGLAAAWMVMTTLDSSTRNTEQSFTTANAGVPQTVTPATNNRGDAESATRNAVQTSETRAALPYQNLFAGLGFQTPHFSSHASVFSSQLESDLQSNALSVAARRTMEKRLNAGVSRLVSQRSRNSTGSDADEISRSPSIGDFLFGAQREGLF